MNRIKLIRVKLLASAINAERLVKRYITHLRKGIFKREKKIVEALKEVSFDVRYGEIMGLLGPNGAGKTTTVKILSTLLIPDGGRAIVAGYDVLEEPEKVRENIGVTLSVEKGFFWKLTGRENLKYFGMLKGLKGKELDKRVNQLLKELGLEELEASDKLCEEYSLGMKARLALSRALLTDPPVVILDEPTLGLDPPSARTIRTLLIDMAKTRGKGVLVTTHNMFEAELICDRVAIINEGVIVAIGTVPELKRYVSGKVSIEVVAGGLDLGHDPDLSKLGFTRDEVVGTIDTEEGRLRVKILCSPGEEEDMIAEVIRRIGAAGGKVHRVDILEPSLEDVFIALTSKREVGSHGKLD
jgi:ABC-2 type transport system ATP-binding protein